MLPNLACRVGRALLPAAFLAASLLAPAAHAAPGDATPAAAGALPRLKITVFAPPSQSIWIPTLIQEMGFDRKHGFQLEVTPKPSTVAYGDFASGADPVCYCASIGAVARFKQQGADITLLWNIFDFDAFIVTNNPAIQKPKDIEGRIIQADTITGSWALTTYFLKAGGVDMSKVQVRSSTGSAASMAELNLKRIDGIGLNPTESSTAIVKAPEPLRAVGVFNADVWKQVSGTETMPAIALGVWRNWIAQPDNLDLARRFYAANLDAQAYIKANPRDAAQRIAGPSKIGADVLLDTFTRFSHLIDVKPMSTYAPTVKLLTQKLLPESKQLPRPLTDVELSAFVSDFKP